MFYPVRTPNWVKKLYPNRVWEQSPAGNSVYLTFDDGPHPQITAWVLDKLKEYGASATFFCIGNNVQLYPGVYQRILAEGHSTGNHTYDHVNGWKTGDEEYLANIRKASALISSKLFRPPYGRMKRSQEKMLKEDGDRFKIVMWSVLSGDFDKGISNEKCLKNVLENIRPGSIIVFHDSEKAKERLQYALPLVLDHLSKRGFLFRKMEE